jgi:hypothetical protein
MDFCGEQQFLSEGLCELGPAVPASDCARVLEQVASRYELASTLFMAEAEYRKNPVHRGVNPIPGRNFTERCDLSCVEEQPAFVAALRALLGPKARILNKKFVVGVPESWLPEWLLEETRDVAVANMGAYVRPEFRDMTYFHGIDFHQDVIDFPARASDFITLYVYLSNTDGNMSPLHVVPQSFKLGATRFPHQLELNPLDCGLVYRREDGRSAALEYRALTGPAGSMYCWHACTLHGTRPHRDSMPRISLRYLLEKGDDSPALIDRANESIEGALSLAVTRCDLDARGEAIMTGNTINKAASDER